MSNESFHTPRDSLQFMLGRMEGKLDAALSRLDRHEDRLTTLEERMGEAEKARTKDRAYAAGIATALTTGIHWFKDHIF